MSRTWRRVAALAIAGALLGMTSAAVADERFDPSYKGGKGPGGILPVKNEEYRNVCGACHFTYSPGLLPARSWELLMSTTDKHFGKKLKIEPDAAARIKTYLTENAADHSNYEGSKVLLQRLSDSQTPIRVTMVPIIASRHAGVRNMRTSVKTLTNCDACHLHPEEGMFATDDYIIPGNNPGMGPDLHNSEHMPTG